KVCVTAQHRAMLDQVLRCFDVSPDFDLDLMTPGQTLAQITARALSALEPPFPEELNRLVTGRLAALHFAPTVGARRNLLVEGISGDRIWVTGNSGIDAVLHVAGMLERGELPAPHWPWLDAGKKL